MAAQLELVDEHELGAFPAHDARSRMSAVAGRFSLETKNNKRKTWRSLSVSARSSYPTAVPYVVPGMAVHALSMITSSYAHVIM